MERQQAFGPAATAAAQGEIDLGAGPFVEALPNEGPGSTQRAPQYLQEMLKENARTLPLMLGTPTPGHHMFATAAASCPDSHHQW